MVFSFFKKKLEKVPEREVVRPKAAAAPAPLRPEQPVVGEEAKKIPEPLPDLEFTSSSQSVASAPKKPAAPPTEAELKHEMSEFERDYTESEVMAINVDHGADSIQSDIEQIVVLYANGQDAVVRPLLESLLGAYPGIDGLRLWLMLFDFLQIKGDRAAFDKLGIEFVQACEMSPPAWRQAEVPAPVAAEPGVDTCALSGMMTADNMVELSPLTQALKSKRPLRVDCSRLLGCDDEFAGRFAEQLMGARRQGAVIVLDEIDAVIPRLQARLNVGEAQNARTWLLVLELLQRHGTQDEFELCAIDFAVTFERSPPSWEAVPQSKLPPRSSPVQSTDKAHFLSGEIKNNRFEDLASVLNLEENVILDFSGVHRIDFVSAGQLVNRLAPVKNSGREVIIRSPNHLVAELMAVIGLNKVARIIVPKS